MIPIAKLRSNLDLNRNLGDVIEVMKLAATVQFNQFRNNREPFTRFITEAEQAVAYLAKFSSENKFLAPKKELPFALILVSSDEGFLGELNSFLLDKLLSKRQARDTVIVLGQQGQGYLEERGMAFKGFPAVSDKMDFSQIEVIRDIIFKLFKEDKISQVCVIYAKFVSLTTQQVEAEDLFPLHLPDSKKDITDLIIEPTANRVIENFVKLWLSSKLYEIFFSSKLSEYAARIMHLEESSKELVRLNQKLKLEYFKYLHSLSDKTIREIVAARLQARG